MDKIYTDAQAAQIAQRTRELDEIEPRIAAARYENGELILTLKGGAVAGARVSFSPRTIPSLADASDEQLSAFEVSANGNAIRWRELEVGIGAPALLEVVCGLRHRSLTHHQSKAGSTRSAKKAVASVRNGQLGGRPRKTVAA